MGGGCTRDSDCSNGRICSADACKILGETSSGGSCWATRDCSSGLFCSPDSMRCTPAGDKRIGDACLFDAECTAGLRCNYTGFNGYCATAGVGTPGDQCVKQEDCTGGLFCGATSECTTFARAFPGFNGVNCPADTAAFHSYFEVPRAGKPPVDFYRLPFPNDVRVKADGKLDLSDFPRPGPTPLGPDLVKLYTDALSADFDGFSGMIPIAFRFSKEIDFGFLPNQAIGNISFVDLSTTPKPTELLGMNFGWTPNRNKFACQNFLTVYPTGGDSPLTPGHTYAVTLGTGAVKSLTGEMATQDPDLAAVLGETRPTSSDELGVAWDKYTKLRAYLKTVNVQPSAVVNATIFTLSDPKADMGRLRAALATEQPPVLSNLFQCGVSSGADPCDDGSDARKCAGSEDPDFVEIHGKIAMPIYQTGTEPYENSGGQLNIVDGKAVKVKDLPVCFALSLPKGASPSAGWPLMVYSHGTGGGFRTFIADGVASAMAKANPKVAVFSFDSVGHGARRGTSMKKPEELVFNVLNPRAARDNFAQGAADILTASQVPKSPAPAGWTGPTLKFAPKVLFFGHSQGSTHGSLALPFADDVPAAIFSGAGANLSLSLQYKTSPVSIPRGIQFLLGEPLDPTHAMLTIWQNFFDRSDPGNFDRYIIGKPLAGRTAKHVYMSWGTSDTYTPDLTLKVNAAYLGVSPVNPFRPDDLFDLPGPIDRPVSANLPGSVTGAVFQYDPPAGVDGHFVATRNANAVKDWTAFVTSFLTSGTPTIPR